MNKHNLKQAIESYDLNFIEQYLKKYTVDNNDQDLLDLALSYRNFNAFELLAQKIQIQDLEFMTIKAIASYLPIAINLVENGTFEKFNNRTSFFTNVDNNRFFPKESILPRQFTSPVFDNNKQTFLHQILHKSLHFNSIGEDDFLVTNYLIENRQALSIKDDTIIKYIVEQNYNINSKAAVNFFEQTVTKLISENVDLSLDKNSYLVQIAAFNNLSDVVIDLHKNGCLIDNFLNRYNDKHNWLSETGENALIQDTDCNNERTYDIYKKFDMKNELSEKALKHLSTFLYYEEMNKKFPSNNKLNTQLKI